MFITTEEGYATSPPGTYTPARPTGTKRPVTVRPPVTWVTISDGICAPCTRLVRRAASSRAALTSGSSPASAASRACGGTLVVARSTPSKRAVYSRTASAPRLRTSSQIGRTRATAASTSVAARGRTPASSVRLRLAGARPRRSMREITRLVYGDQAFLRRRTPPAVHGQQDDQGGEAGPERQRALGAQGQRPAEDGAVRADGEQVVVGPEPDVLAGP